MDKTKALIREMLKLINKCNGTIPEDMKIMLRESYDEIETIAMFENIFKDIEKKVLFGESTIGNPVGLYPQPKTNADREGQIRKKSIR